MDSNKFTWDTLLSIADVLVKKGDLSEKQLVKIIDLVDIKTIVKNNILTDNFIKKHIEPRINLDDYDGIDSYKITHYQDKLKNNINK